MIYSKTCGGLKTLNEVTLPDPRWEHEHLLVSRHKPGPFELADLHERLTQWLPSPAVPENVRVQIETARNLMLYAWYVFEFQSVAEMQAYAALELALRERLGHPKKQTLKKKKLVEVPMMLADLFSKALSDGLIVPEKLPSFTWQNQQRRWHAERRGVAYEPMTANDWIAFVKAKLPDSRNYLAHGNVKLCWTHSCSQVELCCDLINSLFGQPQP